MAGDLHPVDPEQIWIRVKCNESTINQLCHASDYQIIVSIINKILG